MRAKLNKWCPDFDLQHATNEERVAWRRLYTINWLYDLANVFSSYIVQLNAAKGLGLLLEDVEWSIKGKWHHQRRLFGLNEFAGETTTLAMQKETTDTRARIMPQHVFQLQCIVDAFTISQGWTLSPLRGHVHVPPPRDFRPRRDVDLFLDREGKSRGRGLLQSIDVLERNCFGKVPVHIQIRARMASKSRF